MECAAGAEADPNPNPASACPSPTSSDRLLCGLDLRVFSPNKLRALNPPEGTVEDPPEDPAEDPLTAPASLLRTGEGRAKFSRRSRTEPDGRNQSAQDRQGVGGALSRSLIPGCSTSSCSKVAFTWWRKRLRGSVQRPKHFCYIYLSICNINEYVHICVYVDEVLLLHSVYSLYKNNYSYVNVRFYYIVWLTHCFSSLHENDCK